MHIAYVSQSRFFQPIEDVVAEERHALMTGKVIRVQLESRGYNGRICITIRADDSSGFDTDWSNSDPTRFPARIRAAATTLFQHACNGVFIISHEDGEMTIRRI